MSGVSFEGCFKSSAKLCGFIHARWRDAACSDPSCATEGIDGSAAGIVFQGFDGRDEKKPGARADETDEVGVVGFKQQAYTVQTVSVFVGSGGEAFRSIKRFQMKTMCKILMIPRERKFVNLEVFH